MTKSNIKTRLFVESELCEDGAVTLSTSHAHYLLNVMRCLDGSRVALFNGNDGEWVGEFRQTGRKTGMVEGLSKIREQQHPPDLTLYFAPIKKTRTDFIVEKATELGVACLQPVFTDHTNSERMRLDRLQAHMIEAAEQCDGTHVPELREPQKLTTLLDHWPQYRRLIMCDETREAPSMQEALTPQEPGAWGILIGPEGGFSPAELARLRALPFVLPVSLGPRVLRADTAVVAAITIWQSVLGDWR